MSTTIPKEFRLSRAEREAGLNRYPLYMFDSDARCPQCKGELHHARKHAQSTHREAYCVPCGTWPLYDTPADVQATWGAVKHSWERGVALDREASGNLARL